MTDKSPAHRPPPAPIDVHNPDPNALDVAALFQKGLLLQQRGELAQAQAIYARILEHDAGQADATHMLGVIALQMGDPAQAVQLITDGLHGNPGNASAHMHLGLALKALNRWEDAQACYQQAIKLRPDYVQAHINAGIVWMDLGQSDRAQKSFEKAIALKPDDAQAHYNQGLLLHGQKRWDEALVSYQKAIAAQPDFAQALNNCGVILLEQGLFELAASNFESATQIAPNFAQAWYNFGNCLRKLNQFEPALRAYDNAIEIDPDNAQAFNNRGLALQELGLFDQAIASYQQATAIDPQYADAYWNESIDHLLQGNYAQGWPLYEWRWRRETFSSRKRDFPQPLWLGQCGLAGKTILLHAEQGLGDSIQFSRYAALVKAQGARVVLEVPQPLLALFKNFQGVDQLIAKGSVLPDFDYQCPLMSLPLAFQTRLESIPSPAAYLQSDSIKKHSWQQQLGKPGQLRIGLVWSGNPADKNDSQRSMPLAFLLPYLPQGPEYACLQKDVRPSDRQALMGSDILFFGESINDFSDTAALCDAMDLVIAVDSSVAHVAGALGKPCWILLPASPDWRWLLAREDSPWYESVRLYRQPHRGNWETVLVRLASDISKKIAPSKH